MQNRTYLVACRSHEGWFNAITAGPYDAFTPKGFVQLAEAILEEHGGNATIVNIIELKDDDESEGGHEMVD